jgi:DNA-directed RNA polymerase specialized sigma24 family protein
MREASRPMPEVRHQGDDRDLLIVLYRVAELMTPQERMAFALRYFEQRPLLDVARLLDCSLATAKRRLVKAEEQFKRLSRDFEQDYPALRELFAAREGNEP